MTHDLGTVLEYDQDRWPIVQDMKNLMGVQALAALKSNIDLVTRKTDQKTVYHERFYKSWGYSPALHRRYAEIVKEVCAVHMKETGHKPPFLYQAIPTFRVSLPGNMAVGEFHTDGKYHHPDGEINFWMPLTPAYGTNSLWIQSQVGHGHELHPVELFPGKILAFDAVNRLHGNYANTTGVSRVSLDFRIISKARLLHHAVDKSSVRKTINTGVPFAPGGYYARGEVW